MCTGLHGCRHDALMQTLHTQWHLPSNGDFNHRANKPSLSSMFNVFITTVNTSNAVTALPLAKLSWCLSPWREVWTVTPIPPGCRILSRKRSRKKETHFYSQFVGVIGVCENHMEQWKSLLGDRYLLRKHIHSTDVYIIRPPRAMVDAVLSKRESVVQYAKISEISNRRPIMSKKAIVACFATGVQQGTFTFYHDAVQPGQVR